MTVIDRSITLIFISLNIIKMFDSILAAANLAERSTTKTITERVILMMPGWIAKLPHHVIWILLILVALHVFVLVGAIAYSIYLSCMASKSKPPFSQDFKAVSKVKSGV